MRDHSVNITAYLCVGYDITLQRAAEDELLPMAQSDSLTWRTAAVSESACMKR